MTERSEIVNRPTDSKGVKHARGSDGQGRTLCGVAVEGTHDDYFKPPAFASLHCSVTCADCRRIINHCQINFTPHAKVRFDRG